MEDHRPVLGPDVVALAIESGGVMDLEKDLQQLLERDNVRIEFQLDDLGVACLAAANLLVAGIDEIAAGVPRENRKDTGRMLEDRFQAPETTATYGRQMFLHGASSLVIRGLLPVLSTKKLESHRMLVIKAVGPRLQQESPELFW
jgi:hypothetical protein